MLTQVEFRSQKFPAYDGEEDAINSGIWGKRLTEYLARELALYGIMSDTMVVEDWGYYLPLQIEGMRLALCCGHQDGDADQFVVFTDPSQPIVKKFFRTRDATPQFTQVLDALRNILDTDPEIRDIVWSKTQ